MHESGQAAAMRKGSVLGSVQCNGGQLVRMVPGRNLCRFGQAHVGKVRATYHHHLHYHHLHYHHYHHLERRRRLHLVGNPDGRQRP